MEVHPYTRHGYQMKYIIYAADLLIIQNLMTDTEHGRFLYDRGKQTLRC